MTDRAGISTVALLGPHGTFSEQALFTEPDLAACRLYLVATIPEAIAAALHGTVDAAFVPVENTISGPVPETAEALGTGDGLVFGREVWLEVHLDLLAVPGAKLESIESVVSFPHAAAQCRSYLAAQLPRAELRESTSTAEAAHLVAAGGSSTTAAIASPIAAIVYGLEVLAHAIEDESDNRTRFALLTRRPK